MRQIAVNIARLLLAVTFILSGFVKAVDPLGTQYKIRDYLNAMHLGQYVSDYLTLGASVTISVIEFLIGICLLFAIHRRLVSKLLVAMMSVMTLLTLWLALTNPISDCGCFGDAIVLTNWQTFWKNVVLLAAAILVVIWPKDMARMISLSNQWIVFNYSTLFILFIAVWCLYDLPLFDFRPYHVGTNLREGWQKMMEGQDSPYAEFFIDSEDGDITEDVLNSEGYTFLLVSPHLEQADDSQLDRINDWYEYCTGQGYPFYCLTASSGQAVSRWQDITGAEYPFCNTDEITLKTIVRSNPGLVLLKDGIVIRKWSHNRLPALSEEDSVQPLERHEIGQMPNDSIPSKIAMLLMWFVLPLTLLTIADRLWAWSRWLRKKKINPLNKK